MIPSRISQMIYMFTLFIHIEHFGALYRSLVSLIKDIGRQKHN